MKSMSMKEDMIMHQKHHMWHGVKKLVLGLVVLANVYWPFVGWWTLVGIVLVLMGLSKLMMPGDHGHCY